MQLYLDKYNMRVSYPYPNIHVEPNKVRLFFDWMEWELSLSLTISPPCVWCLTSLWTSAGHISRLSHCPGWCLLFTVNLLSSSEKCCRWIARIWHFDNSNVESQMFNLGRWLTSCSFLSSSGLGPSYLLFINSKEISAPKPSAIPWLMYKVLYGAVSLPRSIMVSKWRYLISFNICKI